VRLYNVHRKLIVNLINNSKICQHIHKKDRQFMYKRNNVVRVCNYS